MVNQNLQVCRVICLLVGVFICACVCSCDTTTEMQHSVDDYIENISAHHKNEIRMIEVRLSHMELAFSKELNLVAYNQELVAKTARQLESRMRSTATLNMKAKLCVQHYIGNVTAENLSLQNKLRACIDAAKANSKTITETTRTHLRNSRTQLTDLWSTDLALCRKNHGNNMQKMTDCAREKLGAREININNIMKAATKGLEGSMCTADIIARTAQECSFLFILESHSLLSEIVSNINTCIGDRLLEIK